MNARQRAEAYWLTGATTVPSMLDLVRRPAPLMPPDLVPPEFLPDWIALSPQVRSCAWKFLCCDAKAARVWLWAQVPATLAEPVGRAVALLLGVKYGTAKSLPEIRARIAAEVPEALIAPVTEQATLVHRLGGGK